MGETLQSLKEETYNHRRPFLRNVASEPRFDCDMPGPRTSNFHGLPLGGISKGWSNEIREARTGHLFKATATTALAGGAVKLRPPQTNHSATGTASGASPYFALPSQSPQCDGTDRFETHKITTRRADACIVRGGLPSAFGTGARETSWTSLSMGVRNGTAGCRLPGSGAFGS